MKNVLLILMAGILTTLTFATEPYEHKQTGVSLPETLSGLTRGDVTPYEATPGEAGVAIPYRGEEVEVTIFIRHIDPQKVASPEAIVQDSLAVVKQLEAAGTYSNVKLYQSTGEHDVPGWAMGAYTARVDQAFLMSFVHATVRGEFMIRARLTTSNPKNESIQKFVKEFQKIVSESKPKS